MLTFEQFMDQNNAIALQDMYLRLVHNREDKISDWQHKQKVLSGHHKIMQLVNKASK